MTFTQTPIVFLKNSMGVFIIHMHNSFVVCTPVRDKITIG